MILHVNMRKKQAMQNVVRVRELAGIKCSKFFSNSLIGANSHLLVHPIKSCAADFDT